MTLQIVANAYNAQIDGIYYNLDMLSKTAVVTFMSSDYSLNQSAYSGSIVIPNEATYQGITYTVTSIGKYAFRGCSGLVSATISNNVTSIGEGAFDGCRGLISFTIPNNVTSIGSHVFYNCSSLASVIIPNSVTSIGNSAFQNCSSLISAIIPNGVTTIGGSVFRGCSSLLYVIIPNSVTSIGNNSFQGCTSLTSINIPNSVIDIYDSAFVGCSGLTSVTIGNSVKTIGSYAFCGCSGLTSVTIGNSVITIGNYAFSSCSSLTSLTIPNSVTSIGYWAFSYCTKLTSVAIGISMMNFGDFVFYDCNALSSIIVDSENTKYDSRNDCNAIIEKSTNTLIAGCKNSSIPNSVTSIGTRAFCGCRSLTSITIPYSVTSIGSSAFSECYMLSSITIGNGITSIDEYAFYDCCNLTDVYCYSEKVPETNSLVFNNSNIGSANLYVPSASVIAYSQVDPWKNFKSIIAIPGTEKYYTITYIVDDEVYESYELEEGVIIIPEPMPIKEGYTFSGWSEIPEVMPAHDVTVTGTFTVNKYKVTYMVNNVELKTEQLEYGATIIPPAKDNEGHEIMWNSHPTTMPAYDITIYGSVATGVELMSTNTDTLKCFSIDGKQFSTYQKGLNIVKSSNGQIKKVVTKCY